MIRFIIHTTSSKADVYGNRYHFADITSTRTGRYIQLDHVGGPSNAVHMVRQIADWPEINSINSDVPIRRFNEQRKCRKDTKYEHQVCAEDILALESAE